ncbi:MAG: RagB/SusD family nutrient uptake outer membrane protein [Bacteroidales bacterium]|nr:RagB/SusD family nutrient uptake outer membrane protein [Bacteroidales bacterium]
MKLNTIATALTLIALGTSFSACEDYLNQEPLSSVSPEQYFTDASQLLAYVDGQYASVLPGNNYGYYRLGDQYTDNQIYYTVEDRFVEGEWKVSHSDDGNWTFSNIYYLNYFLSQVLPKYGDAADGSDCTISGTLSEIRHYIGEVYMLRAFEYFTRYQGMGDFPIITEPLADDMEVLTEASCRYPRNEVARFILSDLDKAISLMGDVDMATTRLNADAARLFKSRVALYEATWLKYFKGTAFVPGNSLWPGAAKDYNADFTFQAGSIDQEIDWFLSQAMEAAQMVAEKYKGQLTENTGHVRQSDCNYDNPYFTMFGSEDLSSVGEVLLWRQYVQGVSTHGGCIGANEGNWGCGLSKAYVQNFLMADGSPVYTHGTYAYGDGYYMGDQTIADVAVNRDTRLSDFLKIPGQENILEGTTTKDVWFTEPTPWIYSGDEQRRSFTGYLISKGGTYGADQLTDVWKGSTGLVIFRAAEALLNYMEACYEKNGSLDGSAREYWALLRQRAKVDTDFDKTIAQTDMTKEAENDWAAYSAGQLIDATLYNIRRERRCEFLSEGLRDMDLHRWRAMDQLIDNPWIPEGIHLYGTPQVNDYEDGVLIYDSDNANVSSPSDSEYLRPFRVKGSHIAYKGYIWKMAHYLEPININQMMVTSTDGSDTSTSPIYQNPYWPTTADAPAEK